MQYRMMIIKMSNDTLSVDSCPICEQPFKANQTYVEVISNKTNKPINICEFCYLEAMHVTERKWYIYMEMRKADERGDEVRLAELRRLREWVLGFNGEDRAESLMHGGH